MASTEFGYKGERGADRRAREQKTLSAVDQAVKGAFKGSGVQKTAPILSATGRYPSLLLKSAAQERREAAGQPAGSDRMPSALSKSEAHRRREAVAKIRAEEEAAAVLRRAAEAQAKREADARAAEVARKAAAALQVRRAAFDKATKRVLTVRANIPRAALSANARAVFAHLVVLYTDNASRPVVMSAADAAFALSIKETAAREALDGLKRLNWIVEVTDAFGAKKLMPAAHAAATVEVEA